MSRANAIVQPGETVAVAPGTYPSFTFTKAGTSASARIRWVSTSKYGAKMPTTRVDGHYVDVQGFDITTGNMELRGNYSRAIGNYVHDNPVDGCTSNGGSGLNATGWQNGGYNGHHQEIIGNVVARIGSGALGSCNRIQGIYSSVPDVLIANNIVYAANAFGVHLWHAATRNIIVNNTLVDNGRCIVVGNGDGGGTAAGNQNSIVRNNICSGNIVNAVSLQNASGTVQSNNSFDANPGFVDRAARDYHLTADSGLIDMGTSTNAPSNDFDGDARPRDGDGDDVDAVDIGADER